MKVYRLSDALSRADAERLGVPTNQHPWVRSNNVRAVRTSEFRPPRKGEWYLSGALPAAYCAPNDLGTAFRILRLVHVRKEERWVVVPAPG